MPKTYTISDKQFTLSPVTPKRLAAYCAVLGIKDFSDMKNEEVMRDINARVMNIGLNVEQIKNVLKTCLVEEVADIDYEEIDLSIVDKVLNDFFAQRLKSL